MKKELPTHIIKIFSDVLREKISIRDFEQWIYKSGSEIESTLDNEDYLDLISYNYKETTYTALNRFLAKYIDLAEIETVRLISLLKKVNPNSSDLEYAIERLKIECRSNDYYFLDDYNGFYEVDSKYFKVPGYWDNLSDSNRQTVLQYHRIKLMTITESILNHLEKGTIRIVAIYRDVIREERSVCEYIEERNNFDFTYIDDRLEAEKESFDCISLKEFYSFFRTK